jgi:hypothetical protein
MNQRVFGLVVAALTIFAAAAHAGDGGALAVAQPAQSPSAASSADSASDAPSAAPAAAPETKAEVTAAPAAAAPETKPEATPEVKPKTKPEPATAPAPEKKPVPATTAPAAPAPETKPERKPLSSCAARFEPVADSYQQAHDTLLAWLRAASEKMDAVDGEIAGLKKRIAEKEARITQLKLDAAPNNETQARNLDQETRGLWAQLKTEEARRKNLCQALSSAAGQKVRELNRSVLEALEKSAAQTR